MGRCLIKLDQWYLEWSSITDAPLTCGMSREEMLAYLRSEYGEGQLEESLRRLERCDQTGTSSWTDKSVTDVIFLNRAGPREGRLSRKAIIQKYCIEPENDNQA